MASITAVNVDCSSSNIIIDGTGFTAGTVFQVNVSDMSVSYETVSVESGRVILHFNPFTDGEYCIAVNDQSLLSSDGTALETSNGSLLYATLSDGTFVCNNFQCAIAVTEVPSGIWKLYRMDLKIRPEEIA